MAPLPPVEDRSLRAVGARRAASDRPTPSDVIRTLRSIAQEAGVLVAVLDAAAVGGERHLLSAWAHLGRSRGRGEQRLRDRGAEFALYVAGDDQLPRALAKVGIRPETEAFVVVAEKPIDPVTLLPRFELVADPSVYPRPVTIETLERLGITEADRSAVPTTAWEGLVLERVALLDQTAPAGRAATTES